MALVRTVTAAGVATLTLDSPANRNALSTPLMRELLDALGAALTDAAVRAVVLSHAGENNILAGIGANNKQRPGMPAQT